MEQIRALVVRLAQANSTWGYTRIRIALANLGTKWDAIPLPGRHYLEPAPERCPKTSWRRFLQAYWEVLVAADFFTVEVWTRTGLVPVVVLFVLELTTRRVGIAGISSDPEGKWMTQIGRNLTDAEDGVLVDKSFLLHDRDH